MADLAPGHVLGDRFEVVGVLGHGGMATVYLVQDRLRGAPIALKVLHGHLARSAAMRSRLRREVLAASRLRHPHALVAYDLHDFDGTLAVSMPLHKGRTLAGYVDRHGALTGDVLEKVAGQLTSALREAHATGIVHRDVTPTNVMVSEGGDAVLTDFGLARFTDQLTATGTGALGTAGYAAPEVYAGVRSDPRSDLYGLGAVLYQAATGQAPFHAPDPMGILRKQLADDRMPLVRARPDLPEHLTRTIDAMLAVDPGARPQGAADVASALQARRPAVVPVAPVTALAPRPHLPTGRWTVVVEEPRGQRDRRRHLRDRMRRRGGFEGNVEKVLSQVGRRLMNDLFGVASEPSPEQRLVRAVALEADLPGDALMVPPTVLERRFRLVEEVSERSAQRLARAADQAGFRARAEPVQVQQADDGDEAAWLSSSAAIRLALALLVAALAVGGAVALQLGPFGGDGFAPMPWLLFLFVPFFVMGRRRRRRRERQDALPVAFGSDLRFHLSPDHDALLPPPARDREPTVSPAPVPEAPAAELPRHAALVQRTGDQLDALERSIEASSDVLPAIALRDLRGTLVDLRTEVARLGTTADALNAELAGLDEAGAAAAVDRIESRLERLRTLARTGEVSDRDDAPRLERALASHRAVLEQAELLEGRLTLVLARLLEAGSAATRARVDLLDRDAPAKSAEDLLAQLRQQTEGAREALDEVSGRLPKERRPEGDAAARVRERQRT